MKQFWQKIWKKLKSFFLWLWSELKDIKTLIIFIIVLLIMYFPVYGFYILAAVTKQGWFSVAATAYAAFWAGPFTPFFPLCIAITFGIKKLLLFIIGKKKEAADTGTRVRDIEKRRTEK